MSRSTAKPCSWTDEVLLSFLDGEPSDDASQLARHLEECPRCTIALDESRKVDALLAAQTDTAIDDESAGGLLAFLEEPSVTVAAPSRRRSWLLVAALVVALLLPFALMATRRTETPKPAKPTVGPTAVVPSGGGLRLSGPIKRLRRTEHVIDTKSVLRALRGDWVAGLSAHGLRERAAAVLAATGPRVAPAARVASVVGRRLSFDDPRRLDGPVRRDHDLVIAAAEWWLDRHDLAPVADAVLAASGELRDDLVALLRSEPRLVKRLETLASGFGRARRPTGRLPELCAALGARIKPRYWGRLPWVTLERCAWQARHSGTAASLDALVTLCVAAARSSAFESELAMRWLDGLPAATARLAVRRIEQRLARASRLDERTVLHDLLARLGHGPSPGDRTEPE